MAAGLLLGNLALLIEGSSLRNSITERSAKTNHHSELALSRGMKREPPPPLPLISVAIEGGGDASLRRRKRTTRGASSSKVGASTSSSSGSGGGGGGGEEDWEETLRSRLKEMEEMKELERRAEEIQSQVAEEVEEGQETEEDKRERVKRELEKVAKEQAERRETANLMFELGQKAYGKGMYARAIEFLEAALTIIPGSTLFGGEIQIWLAMAYEANNRHRDCIALYQHLERKHPSISIRRQAAELRYILQAPKLKISKDEMVTIPLIGSSYDSYAGSWSDKYKDRDPTRKMVTTNQLPSSRDFLGDFFVWRPPSNWRTNRAFWAFLALWLGLLGTALLLQS